MVTEQLARAKALLDEASRATGIVDARRLEKATPGMEDINAGPQDYEKATVLVRQAAAELAGAKRLAADTAGIDAARQAGDEALLPAAIDRALKLMGKELEAARAAPHADLFADLHKAAEGALFDARVAYKEGRPAEAQPPLKKAGEALLRARTGQSEHGRFQPAHDALALRRDALLASTVPPASRIKARTDPLVAALAEAKTADAGRDWGAAFKALNAAEVAAAAAEAALDAQRAFDVASGALIARAQALPEPANLPVLAMLTKAIEATGSFEFGRAQALLDNAEARIEAESVKALARGGAPDMGKIGAAIDRMLAAVGGDELNSGPKAGPGVRKEKNGPALVDELVAGFDDAVPAEVVIAIAKKRFGIDLLVSALGRDASGRAVEDVPAGAAAEPADLKARSKRAASARSLYNTLAMTPEQSDRNPSLRTVERRNAVRANADGTLSSYPDGGGWYEAATNKTVMKGRPGDGGGQTFGTKEMATDGSGPMIRRAPAGTKEAAELEVFAPANEDPLDFFEFANVHETGHSVDDRLGFMDARLGNPAFGGWQLHGGDFGAIARPVAAHYAKLAGLPAAAPLLEAFATGLMSGGKPEIPVTDPEDQAALNAACDKVRDEWHANAIFSANPWWSQKKTDTITMDDGRVYQESYAGYWSSYPASERAKGITGYQFRSPAEWFAELFSAYHNGKLKPGHPARKWLSSLDL